MSIPPTSTEMEETPKIKPYRTMRGHTCIRGVANLPDGRRIITYFVDGSFRLWDRESGLQIGNDWRDDGDKGGSLSTIALSPDGKTVAAGSDDDTVRLWDIETGKVTAKWTGHSDIVRSVSWSANVERASVATSSNDRTVRVWDVERGETVLGPIKTGHRYASAVAYSPDTSKIATGGLEDTAIKIWDARTGKLLSTLEQDSQVWSLTWTSDQKKLLAGWYDGSIRIFNTTTWEQIAILEGHTDLVKAICLFQNDRLLASASDDRTARLWNLDTNLPVGPPLWHQDYVNDAAFSADGQILVTASDDKNAYVWDTHAILKEASADDLLSLSNVAGVKSILNTDATRRPTRLKDTPTRVPRHFFDDAQDVAPAPSSTAHEDPPPATPHTDTPSCIAHDNLHSSTTHANPPSSAHRRRHAFAFARPLFGRFAQRFLHSQPNTSEPSELQRRLAQCIVSDDAPSVEVPDGQNNQPDASRHLTQLNDPLRTPQSPLGDAQDHIHPSTPRIHLPSSLYRREAPAPVSRSGTRRGFSGFSRRFQRSQRDTNTSIEFELQRRPTQNDVSAHGPTVVEVPEIRDKQALYVAPQPVRANRRQKNTWLARFFLFICCEPRVGRDAGQ